VVVECAIIEHDAYAIVRVPREGRPIVLSDRLRYPHAVSAIALDSRGLVAHVERCAPHNGEFDILWIHDFARTADGDDDDGAIRVTTGRLAPPDWRRALSASLSAPSSASLIASATSDLTFIDRSGDGDDRRQPRWMGIVAAAFDADDRLYVLDRGVNTRRTLLYQSRVPIARPTRAPPLDPAGIELPCAWNLVADLSATVTTKAPPPFPLEPAFVAVDTFRGRVYVAYSTCVHVVQLAADGGATIGANCDRDGTLTCNFWSPGARVSNGWRPPRATTHDTDCSGDTDDTESGPVCMALGRVQLVAGHVSERGKIEGQGARARFENISGCAIRTRPLDTTRDVAPLVAAIHRGVSGTGARWPPGVADIVEAYARGTGSPVVAIILSDCGGQCLRQIDLH
jgi:hypothetical protein